MAHLTGKLADVISGVTTIKGAHNWSIDEAADTPETTDFEDDGVKSFVPGNTGWTGSFDIKYDSAQNIFTNPPNLNVGQSITFKFYIDAAKYMTGDAIVSGVTTTTPQPDLVVHTVALQGTGVLDKSNM